MTDENETGPTGPTGPTDEDTTLTDDENAPPVPDEGATHDRSASVPGGENDPGGSPEREGIPDLQDGAPEQQRMVDPQQMPVPGERPVAADKWGTTHAEQVEGEPLGDRLAQEEPDVGETSTAAGPPARESGQLSDDPLQERPANQDVFSQATAAEGLGPEQTAVHTVDDDRDAGQLRGAEEGGFGAPEGVGEVGESGEGEGIGIRPEGEEEGRS